MAIDIGVAGCVKKSTLFLCIVYLYLACTYTHTHTSNPTLYKQKNFFYPLALPPPPLINTGIHSTSVVHLEDDDDADDRR